MIDNLKFYIMSPSKVVFIPEQTKYACLIEMIDFYNLWKFNSLQIIIFM